MRFNKIEDFAAYREDLLKKKVQGKTTIHLCAGTGCIACGSMKLYEAFEESFKKHNIKYGKGMLDDETHIIETKDCDVQLDISGCGGFCEMGPLVRITPQNILYVQSQIEDIEEIVEKTIIKGEIIERLLYRHPVTDKCYHSDEDIPFYSKQTRLVLHRCGHINPCSFEEYILTDGYAGLAKAFTMAPGDICEEMLASNLRGRGGAGFLTGQKWKQVRRAEGDIKYVVCNGDEGDPGAFMDRSVMEGDPHSVLEGMLIAAYATGASEGYIYVRAEYPLAIRRLQHAISQAKEAGLLGKNIFGSDFSFDIHINKGGGAFVCGEGSALTASIEGKRGMPRTKPPRTVEKGLWQRPTVLNNVETYANVASIIQKGSEWFKGIGVENNSGTKVFALTGNINNTGLIEVPMGISLDEIIYEIGGGVRGGKKLKAVQVGGPSGGCLILKEGQTDIKMDFDSLKKMGAMMGSGGLVVMDEDTCMVEVARFFMSFTQRESCGKCIPCREGTKRMLEILEKIVAGRGELRDIEILEELAATIEQGSLCGLGQTAANPVVSTLTHFRDEYIAHIVDKTCPAKVCKSLVGYEIVPEACKGCSKCAKVCPVNAISGEIKKPFVIDQKTCIKCGACKEACPFGAIKEV